MRIEPCKGMDFTAQEVAVGLWALAAAGYWYVENPLKHTAPTANATFIREETGFWDEGSDDSEHRRRARQSKVWRAADNFRVRLRHLLDQIGFFEHIGFLAAVVLSVEVICVCFDPQQALFQTTPWKLLVAYVAGNHCLYGVHNLAGSLRSVMSRRSSAALQALAGVQREGGKGKGGTRHSCQESNSR